MLPFDTAVYVWTTSLRDDEQKSPRTIEEYRYVITRLQRTIPLLAVPAVVEPLLQNHRQELLARIRDGGASRSLVNGTIAALRSFYRTLVALGQYPADPTATLRSLAPTRGKPRPLQPEQVRALFAAVDIQSETGLRDRCLLWLYYHSLRNSEAARLTLGDLVHNAVDHTFIIRFPAKGGKERTVVLKPEASADLAAFAIRRYQLPAADPTPVQSVARALQTAPAGTQWGRLFMLDGRALTRRDVNRMFNHYRVKAKLGKCGPHSLRHTCATSLLNSGVDIRTVQEILGHASIRQTEIYTDVLTSTKGQAMGLLPVPYGE